MSETWETFKAKYGIADIDPEILAYIVELERERDAAVADNAALLKDMTTAYGYLREPKMDGSHVTGALDILETRRRNYPGAALLDRMASDD